MLWGRNSDGAVRAAGAGDVDGDGFGDVILLGAADYGAGAYPLSGGAGIYHGASTGLRTDGIEGDSWGIGFGSGYSVAGVGDVNADGFDDVVVGEPYPGPGQVYLHLGFADVDGDGVYLGGELDESQDCDDSDPEVGAASLRYLDGDGDGFGAGAGVMACPETVGTSERSDDCADDWAEVNPTAREVCDGEDNDCDDKVDQADEDLDPTTMAVWYEDQDGDGFGNAERVISACVAPSGHVSAAGDCDDADPTVNPEANEGREDELDRDCDGVHGGKGNHPGCSMVAGSLQTRWMLLIAVLAMLRVRHTRT